MSKDENSRFRRFGKWVEQERLAIISPDTGKPRTQIEAAELAGFSRVQWARIESGASGTKYTTIPLIARGLDRTTPEQVAEVYRRAGFATDMEPVELPGSMRHFMDLPLEMQRDIARMVQVPGAIPRTDTFHS